MNALGGEVFFIIPYPWTLRKARGFFGKNRLPALTSGGGYGILFDENPTKIVGFRKELA